MAMTTDLDRAAAAVDNQTAVGPALNYPCSDADPRGAAALSRGRIGCGPGGLSGIRTAGFRCLPECVEFAAIGRGSGSADFSQGLAIGGQHRTGAGFGAVAGPRCPPGLP